MKNTILNPEDYFEPSCPFCTSMFDDEPIVTRIPVMRVVDKLDYYLNKNDYLGAERHLNYWLKEALECGDFRGALAVTNELMGLKRKLCQKDDALAYATNALVLVSKADLENSVTAGTTYINVATVYKAFGDPNGALELYERALALYNLYLANNDVRLAGLYNNMGLALKDLCLYSRAKECFDKALHVNSHNEGTAPDDAITYLNLADLYEDAYGIDFDGIGDCVKTAKDLLSPENSVLDGYYAFVAEKCAPSFRHFGEGEFANVLESMSARIYGKN